MSIEALYNQARIQTTGVIPDETRQSMPIPSLSSGRLRVSFFFCPASASPTEGVKLWPPDRLCHMDPDTGRLMEVVAVKPSDFNQQDDPLQELGAHRLAEGMTAPDFIEKRARLFELYDHLLPVFAGNSRKSSAEMKTLVNEFQERFQEISEPPLRAYYEHAAQEFFRWLAQYHT